MEQKLFAQVMKLFGHDVATTAEKQLNVGELSGLYKPDTTKEDDLTEN